MVVTTQLIVTSPPEDKIISLPKINNKKQREGWYIPESFTHPAKMQPLLAAYLVEKYSQLGGTVLDPMAGIGTTLIEAIKLGRAAVGVEYEQKFVDIVKANIGLASEKLGDEAKGMVYQGDARELAKTLGIGEAELATVGRKTYLSEMSKVYKQCFAVLKPGGRMVLVTKNFVKKGQQVRLDLDTIRLCETAGFKLADRFYVEVPHPSFFVLLQRRKWYLKNLDGFMTRPDNEEYRITEARLRQTTDKKEQQIFGRHLTAIQNKYKADPYPYFEDVLVFEKPCTDVNMESQSLTNTVSTQSEAK